MKKKYLYLGGLICLAAAGVACKYVMTGCVFSCEPVASISLECVKDMEECPVTVTFEGKEVEDNGVGFVLESSNDEISFDILGAKGTDIRLNFGYDTKGRKNGECLAGEYRSILINGKALPDNVMHRRFVSRTVKTQKDEGITVSVLWDKATDENCVADYRFNAPIQDGLDVEGLSGVEQWGRWSNGEMAKFTFNNLPQKELVLVFDVRSFLYGEKTQQEVVIMDKEKRELAKWFFEKGKVFPNTNLVVSSDLITDGSLELNFHFVNPSSPKELGYSQDPRRLAVGFYGVKIRRK